MTPSILTRLRELAEKATPTDHECDPHWVTTEKGFREWQECRECIRIERAKLSLGDANTILRLLMALEIQREALKYYKESECRGCNDEYGDPDKKSYPYDDGDTAKQALIESAKVLEDGL